MGVMINAATVNVTILSLTRAPLLSCSQLVVVARDEGLPSSLRSTPLQLTINVNKNNFPPVFYLEPYATTIRMDLPQFSSVIDVYANDSDSSVSSFFHQYQ